MAVLAPIVLDHLSTLAAHGYTLAAHCLPCNRWCDFDLPAIIERYGDRKVVGMKPRCSVCGERGKLQVRPPMPTFTGYPR